MLIAHSPFSRRVFFVSFLGAALLVVAARGSTVNESQPRMKLLASIEEEKAPTDEGVDLKLSSDKEGVILTIPERSSVSSVASAEAVTAVPERTMDPTTSAAYADALRREQRAAYINDIISRTYFGTASDASTSEEPDLNIVTLAKITLTRLAGLHNKYGDRPELRYPIEDAMAIMRAALTDRTISASEARAMEEALSSAQRALRTLPEYAPPPAPEHPAASVDPAPVLAKIRVLLDVNVPAVFAVFDTHAVPIPAVSMMALEDSKRLFLTTTAACEQVDPACHDLLRTILHRLKNDLRAPMERAIAESPDAELILADIAAAENPAPPEEMMEETPIEEPVMEMPE